MVPDFSYSWTSALIFTRIMGPIWMTSGTYGYFFTLTPIIKKILEFSPSLRYFTNLYDWWRFVDFTEQVMYRRLKSLHRLCSIGVNFYAESHDQIFFRNSKILHFLGSNNEGLEAILSIWEDVSIMLFLNLLNWISSERLEILASNDSGSNLFYFVQPHIHLLC